MKNKLNIKKFGVILGVLFGSLIAPVLIFFAGYEFFLWSSTGFNKDYRKILRCVDKSKGIWDPKTKTCLTDETSIVKPAAQLKVVKILQGEVAPAPENPGAIKIPTDSAKTEKTLAQIFSDDDLCALMAYQKNVTLKPKEHYSEALTYFLEHSEFRKSLEDFDRGLNGEKAQTTVGRIFSNLVLANLAEGQKITYKGQPQYQQAIDGFESLLNEEPTNAAYFIFEIATYSLAKKTVPQELIQGLEQADHFDTHILQFTKDLINSDPAGAINFLNQISFVAVLPMPNWAKIKEQLKIVLNSRPDLISKISELMTAQGLTSKVGSDYGGFSIFEYAVGRSLIPHNKIPNYTELNKSLGQHFGESLEAFVDLESKCTPQMANDLREHANKLRQEDHYLGFSL